jgi:selenocysteine lyase/cysteine desulfurase
VATDRREFLHGAALLGAALAFPGAEWLGAGGQVPRAKDRVPGAGSQGALTPGTRHLAPASQDPWSAIREQFYISPRGIYFNTGTVGASPRPVVEATVRHLQAFETVFDQQGVDMDGLRGALSRLLDAPPESFAFPRNTTEAMSWVAGGLDLERGGEILLTDQEHVGGFCPFEAAARRHGLDIVKVRLPVPARSAEEVYDAWMRAVSPRTKVAMITQVIFANGLIQPVAELCAEFRRRGIVTAIDGAHPPGLLRLSLRELGCDFYCSSPHKWLLAPKGCGLFHASEEWSARLWPVVVSGGWDDVALKAARFDHLGTRNDSLLAGFKAAMDYHEQLGPDRVYGRIRELGERLYAGLARIGGVELKSPTDSRLRSALISFTVRGWETPALIQELWRRGQVRVRHVAEHELNWVRLSTHVYNTPQEVDTVVGLVREIAGSGRQ